MFTLNRKPLNKVGKKTRANRASNARLKKKFTALGIQRCELGYLNCTPASFLTWAHGKKRRKLTLEELDTCVVLACQNCHSRIEFLAPEAMLAIVESVIAERQGKPTKENDERYHHEDL